MQIGSTHIEETYAEAFGMSYARLLITADDAEWLEAAERSFVGYGSSVIGCDAETGRDSICDPADSPDGRPGVFVMAFGFSDEGVAKAVRNRCGQCLMTCPTTAVFDGLPGAEKRSPLGASLRYYGDGFQKSKMVSGRRFWRIPVMDGEFVISDEMGIGTGVAGGNFILQSERAADALRAASAASRAIERVPKVIAPFPGGVARSGSKVGSRYKNLLASTNEKYCPTLRGRVSSLLHPQASCAYELVIDGADEWAVREAIRVGVRVACEYPVLVVSAGNYGGQLGAFQFHLRELLAD